LASPANSTTLFPDMSRMMFPTYWKNQASWVIGNPRDVWKCSFARNNQTPCGGVEEEDKAEEERGYHSAPINFLSRKKFTL
jgi:hypothetical protein